MCSNGMVIAATFIMIVHAARSPAHYFQFGAICIIDNRHFAAIRNFPRLFYKSRAHTRHPARMRRRAFLIPRRGARQVKRSRRLIRDFMQPRYILLCVRARAPKTHRRMQLHRFLYSPEQQHARCAQTVLESGRDSPFFPCRHERIND